MGDSARKRAETVFTPSRFADEVAALYAEARRLRAPARHHDMAES
jgi:hypothetical protein